MGGGLRKPAAAYGVDSPAPAPAATGAGAGAGAGGGPKTDEELEREEELAAQREAAMAAQQKAAVAHVIENLFPYAPVRVETQRYPPSSPHAGQAYLWITVDEDEIRRRGAGASPVRYPIGVAVDAEGNVFVTERGGGGGSGGGPGSGESATRAISAASIADLVTTNQPPAPPRPPKLVEATQHSLTVRWKKAVDTTADRYELQYRVADSPNNAWAVLATLPSPRDVALENLGYHTPVEFRVRAHNPAGWSEFSPSSVVFWTLPGPPSAPRPPVAGAMTNTYVSLFWTPVNDNGAPPVEYCLEMRHCEDHRSTFGGIYKGPGCSFVVSALEPKQTYMFRLKATNSVGSTSYIESRPMKTLAHGRPEIVELPTVEDAAEYDRWVQCWDPKTEQVFFFNKYTCQRVVEEPRELAERREKQGVSKVEETPEMLARQKRFRFHRDVRQGIDRAALSATTPFPLHRETMYDETFQKFQLLSKHEMFSKFKISFEGEAGIDSGGLTKDWFLQVSKLALEKHRHLFKQCDQGMYEINPNSFRNPKHLAEFRFLGKFVAKAIFDRQCLDLPLCDPLIKHLLHLPITMGDLQSIDPQFHKSLVWMLENDIADVIDETFSIEVEGPQGKQSIEDLKENGRDIPVTDVNKLEYVQLILQWRTEYGIKAQLDSFLQGITSILPGTTLQTFDVAELRMLINGKPIIDVDELRANTVFQGGYNEHSQVVLWLWQALREFDPTGRGLFLKFMTGTNKVPLDGFDPPLNLTKSDLDPQALPRTHTCFNQLVLPEYTSYETLVEKISFAIENAEGFELS